MQEQLLGYYDQLGHSLGADKDPRSLTEAADCYKKALDLSEKLYGQISFQTVEIHLSYATCLEKIGKKAEADQEMQECLKRFEGTNQVDKGTKQLSEAGADLINNPDADQANIL